MTRLDPNQRADVERLYSSLYTDALEEIIGSVPLREIDVNQFRVRCRHAWRKWRIRRVLALKAEHLEPLLYEMVREGTIKFDPTMNGFHVPFR